MDEIFGKFYFIDLDEVIESCKTGRKIKDDDGTETSELNIFKYELLKMCLERLLNEYEQPEEGLTGIVNHETTTSFKFAFNTLLKNRIIIEDETMDTL